MTHDEKMERLFEAFLIVDCMTRTDLNNADLWNRVSLLRDQADQALMLHRVYGGCDVKR